jgi:type VI secretion system ImpB/VipA family protein
MNQTQAITAISVSAGNPPEQRDADIPYQAIIADMTSHREPPKEEDDDAPQDSAKQFASVDVTPNNYDEVLHTIWAPRFKATLPDRLTGRPDSTISIDVTFQQRTKFWPGELDKVPEIKAILERIQQIERLQAHLARQPAARERLARLILDATGLPAPSAN